jgi:hypothetical protein
MKQIFNSIVLSIIATIAIASCNEVDKLTIINLHLVSDSSYNGQDSVKISISPKLVDEYLVRTVLDSSGSVSMSMNIEKPMLASLTIGDSFTSIFLRPGENFTITKFSENGESDYRFKNEKNKSTIAHINNYLSKALPFYYNFKSAGVEVDTFLISLDSLTQRTERFTAHFTDSIKLEDEEIIMLTKINELKLLDVKMWYAFLRHNDFLLEQIYAYREGREVHEYETPPILEDFVNEIEFDTTLVTSAIYGSLYRDILWTYSQEKFSIATFEVENWDKPNPKNPKTINDWIKNETYATKISELLLALNLSDFIYGSGITETVDSLYYSFINEFPHSIYMQSLQKKYNEQVAIQPGKYAPNIRGTNADGAIVNLSDYKGRVVYIDVWARGVGPCVEEIPHSIELQKAFEDSNEVIFLNVSVDRDIEAWKNKIKLEKDWPGIHVNLSNSQVDSP